MINRLDGHAGSGGSTSPDPRLEIEFDENGVLSVDSSERALAALSNPAYVKKGLLSLKEWRKNALTLMEQTGTETFFAALMENIEANAKHDGIDADIVESLVDRATGSLKRTLKEGVTNEALLDHTIQALREGEMI